VVRTKVHSFLLLLLDHNITISWSQRSWFKGIYPQHIQYTLCVTNGTSLRIYIDETMNLSHKNGHPLFDLNAYLFFTEKSWWYYAKVLTERSKTKRKLPNRWRAAATPLSPWIVMHIFILVVFFHESIKCSSCSSYGAFLRWHSAVTKSERNHWMI
jgi:hypothetical protein